MSGKEKISYRLYVMKPDMEGLERAAKERFSRVNERYALIYTAEKMNAPEIADKDVWRLSSSEMEWLAGCNAVLLFEDAQKRQEEIRRNMAERIRRLEEELEKRKEEAGEEGTSLPEE